MRILLVEDDVLLGDSLRLALTQSLYIVDWVKNGAAAWSAIQSEHFDLVILDINLPKLSGDEVLAKMRAKNITTPVIILTGYDSISGRVKSLDTGADDYITKPFNFEELCVRMRAIHRRAHSSFSNNNNITIGDITLDPNSRLVFKGRIAVGLSRREFTVLEMLLKSANKVVPHGQIATALYGWNCNIDSNTIQVHIHNLRKKLGCKNIHTIHGVGYMLKNT